MSGPAPFVFREAPVPEGWPALTPVDEVRIKEYPAYRAAIAESGDAQNSMFRTLFNHIKKNEIAMTAPVEMTVTDDSTAKSPKDMAFLYRQPDMGSAGEDGSVNVVDVPAATMLSTGVRGGYSDKNYRKAIKRLEAWLAENPDQYRVTGPSRYLGYNSPFVPWFMRYGEVQLPVESIVSNTSP